MKTIPTTLLLLLLSTAAFSSDNDAESNTAIQSTMNTEKTNVDEQKEKKEYALNQIGADFIDLFLKKDEKQTYTFLHPILQKQMPYNKYLDVNKQLQNYFGKIISYEKKGEFKQGVHMKKDGEKIIGIKTFAIWYPIKTEKYPDGSIKLAIGFSDKSKNAKITKYQYMLQVN